MYNLIAANPKAQTNVSRPHTFWLSILIKTKPLLVSTVSRGLPLGPFFILSNPTLDPCRHIRRLACPAPNTIAITILSIPTPTPTSTANYCCCYRCHCHYYCCLHHYFEPLYHWTILPSLRLEISSPYIHLPSQIFHQIMPLSHTLRGIQTPVFPLVPGQYNSSQPSAMPAGIIMLGPKVRKERFSLMSIAMFSLKLTFDVGPRYQMPNLCPSR